MTWYRPTVIGFGYAYTFCECLTDCIPNCGGLKADSLLNLILMKYGQHLVIQVRLNTCRPIIQTNRLLVKPCRPITRLFERLVEICDGPASLYGYRGLATDWRSGRNSLSMFSSS